VCINAASSNAVTQVHQKDAGPLVAPVVLMAQRNAKGWPFWTKEKPGRRWIILRLALDE
jgi:hypothetical protein